MTKNSTPEGKILPLLFLGVLMAALDISIVGPALPAMAESMRIQPRFLGWVFSIYVLFNLVGISFFARLSDIFGRRNIYVLSLSIFSIGSFIVSLSSQWDWLLIGRAVQGAGASGIFPVASATIGDIYPPEKRGRALGMVGAVFGIAFLIGPVTAGIVLKHFQWNWLFAINIPISLFLIYRSLRILPSIPISTDSRMDYFGMLLLGLFLGSFTLGINLIHPGHFGKSLKEVLPLFIASFLTFWIFLWHERRYPRPIIQLRLFQSQQIQLVSFFALGAGIAQSLFVFIPDYVIKSYGLNLAQGSFMLIPAVLASAVGAPVSGRMLDKYGSRLVVFTGMLCLSISFLLLATAPTHLLFFHSAAIIFGFGLSFLVGSSLRYIMMNEVQTEERALTQGVITIFISMGQMAGTAGIGAVLASALYPGDNYSFLFASLSLFMALLTLLSFRLRKRPSAILQKDSL